MMFSGMQIDCIKEASLPPQGEGQEEGVFIRLLFFGIAPLSQTLCLREKGLIGHGMPL